MSEPEVRALQSSKSVKAFLRFPWEIYRKKSRGGFAYPQWTPPLLVDEAGLMDPRHNKWYLQGEEENFLVYRNGRVVGRISAHIDYGYVNYQKDGAGFFGNFECEEDSAAAGALFKAAEAWLADRGMKAVMGPINQSPNRMLGCQIEGFEVPSVVYMPWNPPYYSRLILESGFEVHKDLLSYRMDQSLALSEKIVRVAELCRKRERVSIRSVSLKEFSTIVETIRDIYNDAWADRWAFVPWTKEQFEQLAADLKLIINPDLVMLAEIDGEPIAFVLPLPDVNQILRTMNGRLFPFGVFQLLFGLKKIDTLRIAAFGVKSKYRNKGIDALFVHELYVRGRKSGYKDAEFSWILKDNLDLRNMLENWGASVYKTHRIYRKEIG